MTKKQQYQKSNKNNNSPNKSSQDSFHSPQSNLKKQEDQIIQQEPENEFIPFIKYRKSFSVFQKKNRIQQFKTYAKFKPHMVLQKFKDAFTKISGLFFQNKNYLNDPKDINLDGPQQNVFSCKIPTNITMLIHIYRVDNKKCNIKVINSSGYVFAYFTDIKSSRKFPKIYKILKKIGKKNLTMIYDQLSDIENQQSFIKTIQDLTTDFCYYFLIQDNNKSIKFHSIDLKQGENKNVFQKNIKGKKSYFMMNKQTFWFYSEIFQIKQGQNLLNLQKMKKAQFQIQSQNSLLINGVEINDSIHFILECILINYKKSYIHQNEKQMFASFKKIIQAYQCTFQKKKQIKYGNSDDHYPQKMQSCKQCVHCPFHKNKRWKLKKSKDQSIYQIPSSTMKKFKAQTKQNSQLQQKDQGKLIIDQDIFLQKKVRKTKYRCEGCTAALKKDVPICLRCFKDYHVKKFKIRQRNLNNYKRNKKQKLLKKQNLIALNNEQNQKNKQKSNQLQVTKLECQNQIPSYQLKQSTNQIKHSNELNESDNKQQNKTNVKNCKCKMSSQHDSQFSLNNDNHMIKELYANEKFIKKIQKINQQRNKFIQLFSKLIKNKSTSKIALTTAEFIKFKLINLINQNSKQVTQQLHL